MTNDELDRVWRALANPLRRRILDLLRDEGRTPTAQLASHFPGVSRFAVMQHLGVLVDAGLVVVKREGRTRWNHLNPVPIQRIHERWVSRYDAAVAGDLTALKRRAEKPNEAPIVSRRGRKAHVKAPAS
jgi:DNA-binding transcriptional ArsR family regulator